jgi:hypothetical protein
MATYKVNTHQNIWDVALHVSGTIEGMFDLLISNPWLSVDTELRPGMELEYHEELTLNKSIVNHMTKEGYVPTNGERHVYHKRTDEPLVFTCPVPAEILNSAFVASGDGIMLVDWGDNTELEVIELADGSQMHEHYFDSVVDERRIKVYGNFNLTTFDASGIGGSVFPVRPITVDEFTSKSNGYSLMGLFLFEGTVKLNLEGMEVHDLSPLYDMSLQELNLTKVRFPDVGVLDAYLSYLATNYGKRRNCAVYMDTQPSEVGMKAIKTIINEESWNEAGAWKFIINGKIYTKT